MIRLTPRSTRPATLLPSTTSFRARHDKQAAAKPAAGKPKAGGQGGIHDPHAAREAGRYENPIASREAILQLLVDADGPQSADALAEQLQLTEIGRAHV